MRKTPICPICGKKMILRRGQLGEFYGCSRYPDCTTTVSIKDIDEEFGEVTNYHDGENYGVCDRCGEEDTLSEMGLCNYCQHIWDND